jgi:uncharacterized MAPEG superfamily protein
MQSMTTPLLCLLALVAWAIALVVALTVARLRYLARGGSVRDFGMPDDRRLIWRLFRAHANAVENLPLFASVALVAAVIGRQSSTLDALAIAYVGARLGQSIVHVTPGAGLKFNVRFGFFATQLVCLAAFVVILALPLQP